MSDPVRYWDDSAADAETRAADPDATDLDRAQWAAWAVYARAQAALHRERLVAEVRSIWEAEAA